MFITRLSLLLTIATSLACAGKAVPESSLQRAPFGPAAKTHASSGPVSDPGEPTEAAENRSGARTPKEIERADCVDLFERAVKAGFVQQTLAQQYDACRTSMRRIDYACAAGTNHAAAFNACYDHPSEDACAQLRLHVASIIPDYGNPPVLAECTTALTVTTLRCALDAEDAEQIDTCFFQMVIDD